MNGDRDWPQSNGQNCVVIAGAGPGEIDHITVSALRAIHQADVILYDALVGQSIQAEFPASALTLFVGKRCGNHAYTQTMIIAAMIEHALAGRRVLRLKGGDPSTFAHLASEIEALEGIGTPYKIVPGVSAMQAAAAEIARPLTLRQTARNLWVTDGHSEELFRQLPAMARFPGTLVYYMAAGRTSEICTQLIAEGMRANCPAALIENAGSARAQVQTATVADFANGLLARLSAGPGIFIVGEAVRNSTDLSDFALTSDAVTAQF